MLALRHHKQLLVDAEDQEGIKFDSIKGTMIGIVGSFWVQKYALTTIDWFSPSGVRDKDKANAIKRALREDFDVDVTHKNLYFAGKQVARMARLSLIAEELGEDYLARQYVEKLMPAVNSWLEGKNKDALLYDSSWGGIVSTKGIKRNFADFGQAYYNDHHFHYGYHIYAAAVLARADLEWAEDYQEEVLALIRDILEPSGTDPYFPQTRHKDW